MVAQNRPDSQFTGIIEPDKPKAAHQGLRI